MIKKETLKKIFTPSNIFMLLGIVLIFFIALRPPTDPDMGWHLKDGEYLVQHHLHAAKTDIFSYTMPDFPLIMHEWVTDVLMFVTYKSVGLFPLAVMFALIITGAFLLASFGVAAKREYKIIAAILGAIASVPVLGVRPQMFNLLGLAAAIFVIFKYRKDANTKLVYFLPPLFLAWVNLHGGFSVGLFFVGLFLGLEFAKLGMAYVTGKLKARNWISLTSDWLGKNTLEIRAAKKLTFIFGASILATLINPYGWRVYIEVVTTIFDSYAKANIGEWMPVTWTNPMSFQFIIYLVLLGILLLMSSRKIDLTYLAMAVVFLFLAFSSWRHMPIFLIITTPLWVNIVETIAGSELLKLVRKKWFLILLAAATVITAQQQIKKVFPVSVSIDELAKTGAYPLGAVRYLQQNPIDGKMFNEYNWGGFLIWQYPEKKVFIDGRMPSWKIGGFRVFEEFNNTMSYNEGWDKTFGKYDVSFALVYNNPINEAAFGSIGWKKAYSDSLSAIYQKQ